MLSLSLPCTLLCRTIKSALVPQSGDVENPLRRLMCFKDETGKLLCIAMLVHQQQSKTGRKKSTWRLFCLPPEQVRKSLVPLKFPIIRFACVGFCFNQICGENPLAHGGQEVGVASSTVGGQGPGLPGGCKKASSKRVCGHGQCLRSRIEARS